MMRRGILFAFALVACSGTEPTAPVDAGVDGGSVAVDAGFVDAGTSDAGFPDAGTPDAGPPPFGPVTVNIDEGPPPKLSDYAVVRRIGDELEYNERVVPYDLATALFSDFADKHRAIYVPTSTSMTYDGRDAFEFPVGSAIVKTFAFDGAPIETRVLVRYADGWQAFPYVWNDEGTDADYFVRGKVVTLDITDPDGAPRTAQYLIPQKNQCLDCHELLDGEGERFMTVIGPKARHLNRNNEYGGATKNQLVHFVDEGLLAGLPSLDQVPSVVPLESLRQTSTTAIDDQTLDGAARDYLDINCAHCHNPAGTSGQTSRLFLDVENESAFNLGVCKEPGSAGTGAGGRRYDIVPGDAEASILVYRTETETVGEMMPLLGRSLRDDLGARIVRAWVDRMPPMSCD